MKTIPNCKFKIGDKVSHKPDLCGMTRSEVVEIERTFQKDRRSLRHRESAVSSCRKDMNARIEVIDGLPYFVSDEVVDGNYTIKAHRDPFAGYSIVTKNKKMRTMWMEKSLTKI